MDLGPLPLSLVVAILFGAPAAGQNPSAPELQTVGAITDLGEHIGAAGIVASTDPTLNEIYLDGRRNLFNGIWQWHWFWTALSFAPGTGTYLQTFASQSYPAKIQHLSVADFLPRPGDEILVALENGDVFVYDQKTKLEVAKLETGISSVTAFTHHDLTGSPLQEIALIGDTGLSIYSLELGLLHTFASESGVDMVIGQMDQDPGLELAMTSGRILDLATGTIQTHYTAGFGFICLDLMLR